MILGQVRDAIIVNDRIIAVTLDVLRLDPGDALLLHAAYVRGDQVRLDLTDTERATKEDDGDERTTPQP